MESTFVISILAESTKEQPYFLYGEGEEPDTLKPLLFESKEEADHYIVNVIAGSCPLDFYEAWELSQEQLAQYLAKVTGVDCEQT